MKKIFLCLFITLIIIASYTFFDRFVFNEIPKLVTQDEVIQIDKLYVYGTHLNLHGVTSLQDNVDIVLYNGKILNYPVNINDGNFNLANYINDGINLEEIPNGYYYVFLRNKETSENGTINYKYYKINNTTDYKETIYYTFSNANNKIIINSESKEYGTLAIDVRRNKDKNIYDVVVDAGHGGKDSGASKYGYDEADLTMKLALSLKDKLDKAGIKVKLTREENQLADDEKFPDYGVGGRSSIGHEVNAKYLFSIHLNSSSNTKTSGLEVYTPAKINYTFAKELAENIKDTANINYSKNGVNRVYDGIYSRLFTNADINSSLKEYKDKGLKAYDMTTDTNYYFIIRENGGIMTGAYVDDRNGSDYPANPYVNSNIGIETYLLELGYISNKSDLDNIINNMNKYTEAIANSFIDLYNATNKSSE